MTLERTESYVHGYSDGVLYGEADAKDRPAVVHNEIAEIAEEVAGARSDTPGYRAYILGMARGYREVVR